MDESADQNGLGQATLEDQEYLLPPECIPNLEELQLEDDRPVDNTYAEKQHRLLTEPLYSSWAGPADGRPFLALANVGFFYAQKQPPLAPDVMLSLDVQLGQDLSQRQNRSYIRWILGKSPEVVIEFVSDRRGGEDSNKRRDYSLQGVTYYVILDPENRLEGGVLRAFRLEDGRYVPLDPGWLPQVELGLRVWEGTFEGIHRTWLRWADQQGNPIPTGAERADLERQRADAAEEEADQERERAEATEQRAKRLADRLRELGIDPDA